jgi:uncharacterized membrane protein YkoI
MKKILAILLSMIFIMALSACGTKDNMGGGGSQGENSGIMSGENSNGSGDMKGAGNSSGGQGTGVQSSAKNDAKLTADQALDIALKDAGLKKADVRMIENHLDYDNGVLVYDIDFDSKTHEYSYEINAKTGVIVDRDKDIED